MTTDAAAEKILAFVRKHPAMSHADISRVLSMRRQTRQRAHLLLVASGRIEGTLRPDGKTLSWTPREPHRAEPVSEPHHDPVPGTVTVTAPAKPSALSEDQLDFLHGRGRYADPDDPGFE